MDSQNATFHQTNLFGTDLLVQLDPNDPLLQLVATIPRQDFEAAFSVHYTGGIGAPRKPIRLMVGCLLLKQLENLSDEHVVLQWKRNPYYSTATCDVSGSVGAIADSPNPQSVCPNPESLIIRPWEAPSIS